MLRALNIPAGNHEIRFRFDPQSIKTTESLAVAAIIIIYLTLIAAGIVKSGARKPDEL